VLFLDGLVGLDDCDGGAGGNTDMVCLRTEESSMSLSQLPVVDWEWTSGTMGLCTRESGFPVSENRHGLGVGEVIVVLV
jgi:hypothetical protein